MRWDEKARARIQVASGALSLCNCFCGNVNRVENKITTVVVRTAGHESLTDKLCRLIFREQDSGGDPGRLLAQRISQTRVFFIKLNIQEFRAGRKYEIELGFGAGGC